jgi:hypothetical protein
MKPKLTKQTPAALVLAAIIASTVVTVMVACAADIKSAANPVTGLPVPSAIDPTTGLPLPPPPAWKDPNWKDPDKVLPEVRCDGLPINSIVEYLRREFKGAFDVLIPNAWQDPNNPAVSFDPGSTTIRMELKNVTASEVFNAMNLVFEGENTPFRWELKMNGKRPTAVLRVLPQLLPPVAVPPPPPPPARLVYFVGDLIDDEKMGGMTMERLVKTVSEIYEMSYGQSKGALQFHKEAQLLVFTGTGDQIQFVQQTLSALRAKAQAMRKPQPKTKTEENKPQ